MRAASSTGGKLIWLPDAKLPNQWPMVIYDVSHPPLALLQSCPNFKPPNQVKKKSQTFTHWNWLSRARKSALGIWEELHSCYFSLFSSGHAVRSLDDTENIAFHYTMFWSFLIYIWHASGWQLWGLYWPVIAPYLLKVEFVWLVD